jgi:RNA polymerase sigma factor (sigma-70 family)
MAPKHDPHTASPSPLAHDIHLHSTSQGPTMGRSVSVRFRCTPMTCLLRQRPDLLRLFREGEHGALEEVYSAYFAKVAAVVRRGCRVLGGARSSLAIPGMEMADIVQEVFLRAFAPSALAAYDGQRDYGSYLNGIARRTIVDWMRRKGREPVMRSVSIEHLTAIANRPLSHQREQDPSTLEVVRRYIESIKPEIRAVHRVRYEQGLSQRDAADLLGITRQSLRTLEGRLHKGVRQVIEKSTLDAN